MVLRVDIDGTRRCGKCAKWKPLTEEFWQRDARKFAGFRYTCKTCRLSYEKASRLAQASQEGRKFTARDVLTKRDKKLIVNQVKQETPCADCSEYYPHYVMDFDHRTDVVKVAAVSAMLNMSFTWADIESEMDKCDLVCANCHRIRTHERRGTLSFSI